MAKKVRQVDDEQEKEPSFDFPVFDEHAYVAKEYEVSFGMVLAGLMALGVGALSWVATSSGISWAVGVVLGFMGMIGVVPAVQAVHPRSHVYTKGDWATMIAVVFFGWLAVWFLLSDLAHTLV
ncbi:MAG: hypothetical protein ACREBZ_01855 [Thermoplasmata archaeon]